MYVLYQNGMFRKETANTSLQSVQLPKFKKLLELQEDKKKPNFDLDVLYVLPEPTTVSSCFVVLTSDSMKHRTPQIHSSGFDLDQSTILLWSIQRSSSQQRRTLLHPRNVCQLHARQSQRTSHEGDPHVLLRSIRGPRHRQTYAQERSRKNS